MVEESKQTTKKEFVTFSLYSLREFKPVINALRKINDYSIIKFDKKGIIFKSLNAQHTMMFILKLKKHFFNKFKAKNKGIIELDLNELYRTIHHNKIDDELQFTINKAGISIITTGDIVKHQKIQKYPNTAEEGIIPKFNIDTTLKLKTKNIKNALNQIDSEETKITLRTINQNLMLQDKKNMVLLDYKPKTNKDIKVNTSFNLIKHLKHFDKFSKTMKIGIKEDFPLIINMESTRPHGHLKILIAPRMERDE
jgi:hypothetical protein